MGEFKNDFSFSYSRHQQLKDCPRQYYWRRYGYWDGWKDKTDTMRKRAWLLKRLSSPQIHMGNVLHDMIAKDIESLKAGKDLGASTVLLEIQAAIVKGYEESAQLAFLDPKNKTAVTFTGDYYPSMNRWLKPPEECMDESSMMYMNWYNSKLRAFLKKNPRHIKRVEVLEDMEVMRVKVYVKMDLLMSSRKISHLIVDFKTGKRSKEHPDQLALYGMYLHRQLGVPLDQIGFQLVYLREGSDITEDMPSFTMADFERASERILAEVVEEQAYLQGSVKDNIAKPISAFPQNKGDACRFCVYRELCEVEKGINDNGF